MTVVTHYDTLKITRDAPPELIQAVYKALAQKYHPDKNLNNPEAVRMMQMVITSYKVLADVFGEAGQHARAAVGMSSLPLGACVEVQVNAQLTG